MLILQQLVMTRLTKILYYNSSHQSACHACMCTSKREGATITLATCYCSY